MITVKLQRKNGRIVAFEVSGHSGYADAGADIVCASVSSVVWTVINGLENVIGIPVECHQEDAFVSCKLPHLSSDFSAKAAVLLDSMVIFFDNLTKQYGDFISKSEV